MKSIAYTTTLLALLSCSTAYANSESYLRAGTQELNIQGLVDFDAEDSYAVDLNAKYGYFIKDNWELGTNIVTDLSKSYKSAGIGLFTEYNFTNGTNFVPYVGLATELIRADYNDREDNLESKSFDATAVNFKTALGMKYFISRNVALSAEVNYNIATDHLKVSGGDAKDSFTKFLIGTSVYF
ncbi:outer membrane beta-barrel protein [Aeromonas veronii]|uniref:outer membrane beta-barrel protein n=1 Tax=Aeromonas veronii TaxID=654 RepID=UPI000B59A0C1|nr:outer membrane beta-barrel protein [Aeromonas veronii]